MQVDGADSKMTPARAVDKNDPHPFMTRHSSFLIPATALTADFAVAPVAPEAGNILFLACGAVGLAVMWPAAGKQLRRPIVWMPLVALLTIGLAYLASAGFDGLAGLLYFAPLLAIWPLVSLSAQADDNQDGLGLGLAVSALSGVSAAAIMAVIEVLSTGTNRAGGPIANPIHFADVALLVGFVALFGVALVRGYWRLTFVLGPVAALIAVALSGTRGAVVAFVVMLAAFVTAATLVRLVRPPTLLLGLAGLCGLGILAFATGLGQLSGFQRVLSDLADTLVHGVPTDNSTSLRLQMYLGGWRAFLESPIIGHGPLQFTAVADSLADVSFGGAPHLHNDLVDMAASAGILGIAGYLLIILAPLVEAWRSAPSRLRPWSIAFVATLICGFVVMGFTNAMFGILNVTTTFAAICVTTGLLTRPRRDA